MSHHNELDMRAASEKGFVKPAFFQIRKCEKKRSASYLSWVGFVCGKKVLIFFVRGFIWLFPLLTNRRPR